METDAGRLSSIKEAGGQLVRTADGEFWAIFDEAGASMDFDSGHINSSSPQLTLRTSDAVSFNVVARDSEIDVDGTTFTVRERITGQAPGWTVLILSA